MDSEVAEGEKPFHCDSCQQTFSSDLQDHICKQVGEESFRCDFCQRTFARISNLQDHICIELDEGSFCCDSNQTEVASVPDLQEFTRLDTDEEAFHFEARQPQDASDLQNHIRLQGVEETVQKEVANVSDLQEHLRFETGVKNFNSDTSQHAVASASSLQDNRSKHKGQESTCCNSYQRTLESGSDYQEHTGERTGEKQFHHDMHKQEVTSISDLQGRSIVQKVKGFTDCDSCELQFESESDAKNHMRICNFYANDSCQKEVTIVSDFRIETVENPFYGDSRQLELVNGSNLKEHGSIHKDKEFTQCDSCKHRFPCVSGSTDHMRTCSFYANDSCPREVANASDLRIETGEKPPHCDSRQQEVTASVVASDLQEHRSKHKGEEPTSCDSSKRQFGFVSNLLKHLRIFSFYANDASRGEVANVSDLRNEAVENSPHCDSLQEITRVSNIQEPGSIHKGAESTHCESCKRQFSSPLDLEKHMRSCSLYAFLDSWQSSVESASELRIGTGEKPSRCESLQQELASVSDLQEHGIKDIGEGTTRSDTPKREFGIVSNLLKLLRVFSFFSNNSSHVDIADASDLRSEASEKAFQSHPLQQEVSSESNLKEHSSIHKGKESIHCESCKHQFSSTSDLEKHMRACSFYANDSCEVEIANVSDLRIETVEKSSHCEFLQQEVASVSNMQVLSSIYKDEESIYSDPSKGQPESASNFQKRMRICSFYANNSSQSAVENVSELRIEKEEKPSLCESRQQELATVSDLQEHRSIHKDENSTCCDSCKRRFESVSDLQKHMRICSPHANDFRQRPTDANVCDIRIETGEQQFYCDYCQQTFVSASDLLEHVGTHAGENPFICDVCQRTFRYSTALSVHLRNHAEERK